MYIYIDFPPVLSNMISAFLNGFCSYCEWRPLNTKCNEYDCNAPCCDYCNIDKDDVISIRCSIHHSRTRDEYGNDSLDEEQQSSSDYDKHESICDVHTGGFCNCLYDY